MSSSQTPQTLHRFLDLPSELQDQIWALAIEAENKIIEIKHYDFLHYRNGRRVPDSEAAKEKEIYRHNTTSSDRRRLFNASKGSRKVLQEKYDVQRLKVMYKRSVYFIPRLDTIYFGPSSYVASWNWPWVDSLDARDDTYCGYDRFGANILATPPSGLAPLGEFAWGWHPLMMSREYKAERMKIQNVAVELNFWLGTQAHDDEAYLVNEFPNIRRFTVTTGDLGERATSFDSGYWGKFQFCMQNLRLVPCCHMFGQNLASLPAFYSARGRKMEAHLGDITFKSKCVPIDFTPIRDVAYDRKYPRELRERLRNTLFQTRLVERGGVYYGHDSRIKLRPGDWGCPEIHRPQDEDGPLCVNRSGWTRTVEALVDY
ncbi:hypothetical protein GLAREA_05192 [Glarea lozoyensis ATCC 20868]|uniref:2EXR domain-containing protein n=1 Tax=Glarea lozoyensis (strain ATCC 20868 / MF5171) TaxID=1116229 RepID=S3DFH1_GLAL2|nr:uncharacterized protein GLAREA_05192 [Glarea lozoyensis ATCC 20868]EPE35854.1 hypothetical protein GLAREA_05192 [Glarea lozoyensis ATCC 20868]